MTILVDRAGLQTLVQAAPRSGFRHAGVPASGAADRLSLALANRLVGNPPLAPGLEAALLGPALTFDTAVAFALCGADAGVSLNGEPIEFHRTHFATAGDRLDIGAAVTGARVYIAFAGGLDVNETLGSASTFLPAGLGGLDGRALRDGDVLGLNAATIDVESLETPPDYRPRMTRRWAIRVVSSAESGALAESERSRLFGTNWTVGRRADRMGIALEGAAIDIRHDGRMPSVPVFPGTIQCPNDGVPYLLGIDAGTTGGYPRIGQVARLDRHILGQLRPGDHLRLVPREPGDAIAELKAKHAYWQDWLPGVGTII